MPVAFSFLFTFKSIVKAFFAYVHIITGVAFESRAKDRLSLADVASQVLVKDLFIDFVVK